MQYASCNTSAYDWVKWRKRIKAGWQGIWAWIIGEGKAKLGEPLIEAAARDEDREDELASCRKAAAAL